MSYEPSLTATLNDSAMSGACITPPLPVGPQVARLAGRFRALIRFAPNLGARYSSEVRIIARRTLREFWERPSHQDSEQPLRAWFAEASKADWANPADIKKQHRNASIVGNSRVIFNIGGNKYRLVVAFKYEARIAFIRFAGTHAAYDRIDVEKV